MKIAFFVQFGTKETECVNFFSHNFDEFGHFLNGCIIAYSLKYLK